MRYLALDIGRKHTGVSFADSKLKVPVPLETFHHDTVEELVNEILLLVSRRNVEKVIVGLPLLSHGVQGKQAQFTREVLDHLREACPQCAFETLDERFTNAISGKGRGQDLHAQAAVQLLSTFLERRQGFSPMP